MIATENPAIGEPGVIDLKRARKALLEIWPDFHWEVTIPDENPKPVLAPAGATDGEGR